MELLLQAIEKKLANVDIERKRWTEYKTEHEQAGNNLREFQKSFRKEILVPIGSKALMPGHLYHTNEILVSMYHGLFVKCSADKALNVCEHRIGEANKRIDALNVEDKMYRDRLELPAEENVFDGLSFGAREIIEEYNEENEQKWREQHKISMRAHKQAEAEERKRQPTDDDIDINAILEQAELMEELENDLEELNVSSDEHLQQHLRTMNGESVANKMIDIGAGAQHRPQHTNNVENDVNDELGSEEFQSITSAAVGLSTDDKIKFYEIHLQKIGEYFATNTRTIQNTNEYTEKIVTRENIENAIEELRELESDTSSTFSTEQCEANKTNNQEMNARPVDYTESIQNPNEPRKFHTRSDYEEIEREYAVQSKSKSELLVFYKGQLSHIVKLIASCTATNVHTGEQKRDLYEFLSDRISSLREEIQKEKQIKLEDDFVDDDDIEINTKPSCRNFDVHSTPFELDDFRDDENGNSDGKRKINFAPQPSVITFFEDDEPCIVSQQNENSLMDATFEFFNSPSNSSASSVCDEDEDNKYVRSDGDSSAKSPVPLLDSPCKNLKRRMNYTNDCDINVPMNQFNECTMNNKVDDSCSNIVNTIMGEAAAIAATAEMATKATSASPSQCKPTTLVLQFNHSTNACTATISDDDDTINSPLDIYRKFGSVIESASNRTTLSPSSTIIDAINRTCQPTNTDQTNTPKVKLSNDGNNSPLTDAKPLEVPNINQKPSKSILKKKNLVEHEIRASFDINDDIEDDSLDENNQFQGYPKFTQVLGEIVEHGNVTETNTTSSQSNAVEIIPTQTSVNSDSKGQPKKRVSLFKKSRMS